MSTGPPGEQVGVVDQSLLRPYVPRLAVDWLRNTPERTWREVEGSLAFVDISGFTKLTERLARKGRIGAEEMSDTLSATFSALLTVAYEDGAGLVKWGGDAVLLLFEGDDHAAHAARAAFRMRESLRSVGQLETSAGKVRLRMSVGIHSGTFHFFLVGDPDIHRELLVSGPAASVTAQVEGWASAGQIGVSTRAAALLPPELTKPVDEAWSLLGAEPMVRTTPAPYPPDITGLDIGSTLSRSIRAHLLGGGGEPEHRHIGVGFVQFSGTDALLATHGPGVLADALDECMRTVQNACVRHGVTFFETDINRDGGKVMLVAGAPLSNGSNEERMLLAARHILDRPGRIPVRIGVNSGPVFTGDFGPPFRRTFSVKGDAINLAARVMAKAVPGQLLATQASLAKSATTFDVEPLPPFLVKGKAKPIAAASVGAAHGGHERPPGAGVGVAPLVGREQEMATLLAALDRARSRRGVLVELVGEPGIGKSRLVDELTARADDVHVLFTACEEYESASAYFPFRSLLRDVAGIPVGSSAEAVLERLTQRVAPNHPELVRWLPLLGVPLDIRLPDTPATADLDERYRKDRLADVVVQFLTATLPTPTMLVFDDVHLMDESSADLMRHLAERVALNPWTVLVTRRDQPHGFVPDSADSELVTVRPAPLDAQAATSLVWEASEDAPLTPHEIEVIAARAGGNPLFIRSLVAAARSGGGAEALPDRLEDVINAQIDRLPTAERTLLRFAAVLGIDFTESELRALMVGEELPTGRDSLRRLGEFLEIAGHGRFRFRHALLRDAAYEGLSYRRRQLLHGRVGATIESAAVRPDDEAELLSMHYLYAAKHDLAWHYSIVAGERSKAKYAYAEAAEFYRRAIETARRLPEVGSAALSAANESLADAFMRLGDYDGARARYQAARRHCREQPVRCAELLWKEAIIPGRQGRSALTLRLLSQGLRLLEGHEESAAMTQRSMLESSYAGVRHEQGRYREARRWALRAEEHARAVNDAAALAEAYAVLHGVAAWTGLGKGESYGERALELFTSLGYRLQRAHALNNLASSAFFEGRWLDATAMFEEAFAEYRTVGAVYSAAVAQFNVADVLWRQNRFAEAEETLRQVRRVARGLKEPELLALAERELGRTLVLSGRPDEGLELLQAARDAFLAQGARYEELVTESALAEYLLSVGEPARALERAESARARAEAAGASTLRATFSRLQAEALLAQGDASAAAEELTTTLSSLAEEEEYERGFLLLDLTRAHDALGQPDVIDLRDQAHAELSRLGVVAQDTAIVTDP